MNLRLFEWLCLVGEKPLRIESAVSIARNVRDARQVGLAFGMQSANPTPAQRVAGRVAVNEVAIEKVSAQLPGQPQGVHPYACEPHSRMVVEVTRRFELVNPGIETIDSGLAVDRVLITDL